MARAAALVAWFAANGGYLSPSMILQDTEELGIHGRAIRDIDSHDAPNSTELIRCPLNLTLSHLNAAPPTQRLVIAEAIPYYEGTASSLVGHVAERTVGVFFLVEQRLLGEKSFWFPYIASLPKADDLTTPLYFSEEDMIWLQGTNLHSAARDRREMWHSEWESACSILRSKNVDCSDYTWELCLWATTIYTSRSFRNFIDVKDADGDFTPMLFPVLDALDHKHSAQVTLLTDDKGGESVLTNQDIADGEIIYTNYGPKSNESLLMGYGFAIESNPFDTVALRLVPMPPKVEKVVKGQFPDAHRTVYHICSDHKDSPARRSIETTYPHLKGVEHFATLPAELLFAYIAFQLCVRGKEVTGPEVYYPSARLVLAATRDLNNALMRKLNYAIYSPPPSQPANRKQRYAEIYRNSQIHILRAAVEALARYQLSYVTGGPFEASMDTEMHRDEHGKRTRLIDLPTALEALNKLMPTAKTRFLSGIENLFNTQSVPTLRKEDNEDVVFMLLLSYVNTFYTLPENATGKERPSKWQLWLDDVRSEHPLHFEKDSLVEEQAPYVHEMVQQVAQDYPESIWAAKEWTAEVTAWGVRVMMNEGLRHHGADIYLLSVEEASGQE